MKSPKKKTTRKKPVRRKNVEKSSKPEEPEVLLNGQPEPEVLLTGPSTEPEVLLAGDGGTTRRILREEVQRLQREDIQKMVGEETRRAIDEKLNGNGALTRDDVAEIVRSHMEAAKLEERMVKLDSLRDETLQEARKSIETEMARFLESDGLREAIDRRTAEQTKDIIVKAPTELRKTVAESVRKANEELLQNGDLENRIRKIVEEQAVIFASTLDQELEKFRRVVEEQFKLAMPSVDMAKPQLDEHRVSDLAFGIVDEALKGLLVSDAFLSAVREVAADQQPKNGPPSAGRGRYHRHYRKSMRRGI